MPERSKNNDVDIYVTRSILANNPFDITEVKNIGTLNSFYFISKHYENVKKLIEAGNLSAVQALPLNQSDTFQYYYVMTFADQKNRQYVVTVYDSNELWQYPQIIEVFPYKVV